MKRDVRRSRISTNKRATIRPVVNGKIEDLKTIYFCWALTCQLRGLFSGRARPRDQGMIKPIWSSQ